MQGEPGKRADHGKKSTKDRSKVQAQQQEGAEQREERYKSVNHWRNFQATLDQDQVQVQKSEGHDWG